MNCDECKEQVLDLIEREAVDPDGVREILARCPDCRALFDEMQTALRSAAALPLEEPPAEIDAEIVRAARQRSAKAARPRRRWFQSPQWAVAAVALLAVGIGLWSIPRREEVATDDASSVREEAAPEAEASASEAPSPGVTPPPVRAKRTERNKAGDSDRPAAAKAVAAAPARRDARQAATAGTIADTVAFEEGETAPTTTKEQQSMSAECRKRLADLDARIEKDEIDATASTSGEDALALGRCYQEAGDIAQARAWFERAASDPRTKRRAMRALRALPAN